MLKLVEPLLQTDLLHFQQGTILDFIQGKVMLLSKVIDQRVLWKTWVLRKVNVWRLPPLLPHCVPTL